MTPQEALAQALHGNGEDGCSASLTDCDIAESFRQEAAAILDALPEGWVLADATTGILNQMHRCGEECGAQQERERLRAQIEKRLPEYGVGPEYSRDGIHGWRCEYKDRYGPCDCFDQLLSYLFADPEDDR